MSFDANEGNSRRLAIERMEREKKEQAEREKRERGNRKFMANKSVANREVEVFDIIVRCFGAHHRERSLKLERTQILVLPDEQAVRITLRPDQVAKLAEVKAPVAPNV
jgi:predicted type IV restriction endonuclease